MSGKDEGDARPGTLGAVLYAERDEPPPAEKEWADLLRSIAGGDQRALHALYERTHRLVFTLTMRITNNPTTAEELTMDVFYDIWRHASKYEPAGGTVLGWILNQARSRAIDRLRFDGRQKRVRPDGEDWQELSLPRDSEDAVALRQQADHLRKALVILTPEEREAIEIAYFSGLTYSEVAELLNQPLGTIKTRIRSGLAKLREALVDGMKS